LKAIRRLLDDKTAKLPPNAAPSKILTADYEVIPFDEVGRREELELLTSFCADERRRSVLLLAGEGGTGKTRLLIEWCRRRRDQGWHAGFLYSNRKASDLDPLFEGIAPRLVVVDYAETRLQVVEALLLKAGVAPDEEPKVRLVLLARQAGGWWSAFQRKERAIEDLLLASPAPRHLTPLVALGDRPSAFRSAVGAFAAQSGRDVPANLIVPDLSDQDFERVLYLHMAALAGLEGERIESARDALERTLKRERRFWDYHVSELGLDGVRRRQMEKAIELAIAALTFLGGASGEQEGRRNVAYALAPLDLASDLQDAIFELLENLCGGSEGERARFLEPLKPDLLGEQLVVERWAQDAVRWQDLMVAQAKETNAAIAGALTMLTRLASRQPAARAWLATALKERGEALVSTVLDVAVDTGDPISLVFAQYLEDESFILLARVMILCHDEWYQRSIPLREVALVATSRVLATLKIRWSSPTVEQQAELARLSVNLGQCLRDLGREEEALQVTREAVQVYRQFARRPGEILSPHLAAGLNNLGTLLSELGQREEALQRTEEALAIFKRLEPDSQEFRSKLAACLDNQANRLGELGRHHEAVQVTREALLIHRELVARGGAACHSDLAGSLDNLGAHLRAVGFHEEAAQAAQEAIDIRRFLAEQRPDVFTPDLATSLGNLGAHLAGFGQQEKSLGLLEEGVEIWRKLAGTRLDAFRSDIAGGLENLGTVLGDLGQYENAEAAFREAIEMYRPLAARTPALFEPKLARALSGLSNVLSDMGRSEEALELVQLSEDLIRRLSQERPSVFSSDLAGSLVNLSNRLAENCRREDALRTSREAVALYRQLFAARPEALRPELALAVMNHGNRLRDDGRVEEALAITKEAVGIYRQLAEQRPEAFLPDLARSLNNLGLQLGDSGQTEESRQCLAEAIRILRPFHDRRQAFLPWMRTMVQNYRESLQRLGRDPDEELLQ